MRWKNYKYCAYIQPVSNINITNLSFQAVKQEEEMNQQSLELAEARKNYTIESEKVSSVILEYENYFSCILLDLILHIARFTQVEKVWYLTRSPINDHLRFSPRFYGRERVPSERNSCPM